MQWDGSEDEEIRNCIREKRAYVVCDRSKLEKSFGRYFVIIDDKIKHKISEKLHSTRWEMNIEVVTEEIIVLNLFERVKETHGGLTGRRIMIYIDNKMVLKNIILVKTKPSQYIFDYRVINSRIGEIFKELKVEVIVEYSESKPIVNEEYRHNRGAHLMKICDKQSKEIWKKSYEFWLIHNIKSLENYAIKY